MIKQNQWRFVIPLSVFWSSKVKRSSYVSKWICFIFGMNLFASHILPIISKIVLTIQLLHLIPYWITWWCHPHCLSNQSLECFNVFLFYCMIDCYMMFVLKTMVFQMLILNPVFAAITFSVFVSALVWFPLQNTVLKLLE